MKKYWAGNLESYSEYMQKHEKMEAYAASREHRASEDEDDWGQPESLFSKQGDVGIVSISGPLIPGEASALHQMFGMQGYENIKSALVEAVSDQEVKNIVLHVDSGGGAVDGVRSASEFIRTVSAVKPIAAYCDYACSAAYWLASSANHLVADETSMVGSIGVLRVHTEYSKMLEEEGVTSTVLRAGKYKTLLNPYEPLTEDAIAQEQEHLDTLYKIFVDDIADKRGTTAVVVDTVMGQGRTFLGNKALASGLIDEVGDFQSAVMSLKSTKKSKHPHVFANQNTQSVATLSGEISTVLDNTLNLYSTGSQMKLTKEQLEAIASGVSFEAVTGSEPTEMEASTDLEVPAEEVAEDVAVEKETQEENNMEAELVAAKAEAKAATAALAHAQINLDAAQEQLEKAEQDAEALACIVRASVAQMNVALNRKVDVEQLSASELASVYAETKETLGKTFKSSGVARSTASTDDKPAASAASAEDVSFLLRAKSIQFTQKG